MRSILLTALLLTPSLAFADHHEAPADEAPADEAPPPTLQIQSQPPGASVRVVETDLDIGTTPVLWTPDEAVRSRLEAGEAVTLILTTADGRTQQHALATADLSAPDNDLTVTLPPAPKPKSRRKASKQSKKPKATRPAAQPKPAATKPATTKRKPFSLF